MWLEAAKRGKLLTILKGWVQLGKSRTVGTPGKEFESTVAKIRHAFTCIPGGVGLLSPCNRVLRARPAFVYLNRNQKRLTSLEGAMHSPMGIDMGTHKMLRANMWVA